MRLAIVHYHLRPGGVTRFIERQVAVLESAGISFVVLTGEPPPAGTFATCPLRVVSGIGYAAGQAVSSPSELVRRMEEAARSALGSAPEFFHFHNSALGKNPSLTQAVELMAEQGLRLLLHLYDFAEDGRPELFRRLLDRTSGRDPGELGALLYPQAEHVHYAALASPLASLLCKAGVSAARVHYIPPPVALPQPADASFALPPGDWFVYPTRAIRRKNIGELLLWAAMAKPGERFAMTLAPVTKAEREPYECWKHFSSELGLPVEFEAADKWGVSLETLLACSKAAVTTSVGEGFGLAFLEPWLMNRPVLGRSLPDITHDFESKGVSLSHLYRRLRVPWEWVDAERVLGEFRERLRKAYRSYERVLREESLEQVLESIRKDQGVDFGILDMARQQQVIRRLAQDPGQRRQVHPNALLPEPLPPAIVRENAAAIQKVFGVDAFLERQLSAFQSLMNAETGGRVSGLNLGPILDAFLSPQRVLLWKT